jgi:uncharacterized membrane protein YphA (DoxX/SURF4 family)
VPPEPAGEAATPGNEEAPVEESVEAAPESSETPTEEPAPATGFWRPLRDTRVWGLLAIRAYLALVFFQAGLDHLAVSPTQLAAQWALKGPFAPLGAMVSQNPALFIHLVIGFEFALAISVTLGLATRLAGLGGLLLNALFFGAFEWTDTSQLYLSWDASFALLWLVVLVTAPGRYLGLSQLLARRFPRLARWIG